MKLNTPITPHSHPYSLAGWLTNRCHTFNLPTEFHVTEPRFVVPRQGRYYETGLYVRGEKLLTYEELRSLPDFNGVSHETKVYLYEVWENYGDDGHTDYFLRGWLLHAGIAENPLRLEYPYE